MLSSSPNAREKQLSESQDAESSDPASPKARTCGSADHNQIANNHMAERPREGKLVRFVGAIEGQPEIHQKSLSSLTHTSSKETEPLPPFLSAHGHIKVAAPKYDMYKDIDRTEILSCQK